MTWVMQEDQRLDGELAKKKHYQLCVCYYISFMLLLNWIPLTEEKTLMVCDFVLIDLSVML